VARIAGINIPVHKHTEIALTAIFGIGRTRSREICTISGISPTAKIKDLTEEEVEKLRTSWNSTSSWFTTPWATY